jgi:hypothetical protein
MAEPDPCSIVHQKTLAKHGINRAPCHESRTNLAKSSGDMGSLLALLEIVTVVIFLSFNITIVVFIIYIDININFTLVVCLLCRPCCC